MSDARPDIDMLARRVRHRLRRIPPAGCYEGFDYSNLWGEFCHWIRYTNRGPVSDRTWYETVILLIGEATERIPQKHLPTLTEMAEQQTGEFHSAPGGGFPYVDLPMIGRAVWGRLTELAEEQNISRFVPIGLRDHYF